MAWQGGAPNKGSDQKGWFFFPAKPSESVSDPELGSEQGNRCREGCRMDERGGP